MRPWTETATVGLAIALLAGVTLACKDRKVDAAAADTAPSVPETEPASALATTRANYVGYWEGNTPLQEGTLSINLIITLSVRANGDVVYRKTKRWGAGNWNRTGADGSILYFGQKGGSPYDMVVGKIDGGGSLVPVDSPPSESGGVWSMKVEGVTLQRMTVVQEDPAIILPDHG